MAWWEILLWGGNPRRTICNAPFPPKTGYHIWGLFLEPLQRHGTRHCALAMLSKRIHCVRTVWPNTVACLTRKCGYWTNLGQRVALQYAQHGQLCESSYHIGYESVDIGRILDSAWPSSNAPIGKLWESLSSRTGRGEMPQSLS